MDQYQHDDKCRWWDDEEFCTCGAIEIDRLEKELAAAKEEIEWLTARYVNTRTASELEIADLKRGLSTATLEIERLFQDAVQTQRHADTLLDKLHAAETALTSERKETERLRQFIARVAEMDPAEHYIGDHGMGSYEECGQCESLIEEANILLDVPNKAALQSRQGEE